jgi:5-methylcytosine-specific restriction endonuclease McrA
MNVAKVKDTTRTSNARIRQALRQLWLRSKERATCLKRDSYTCQECHRKQSMAKGKEFKVEVHHKSKEINWEEVIKYIRDNLLVDSNELITLCGECHKKEHKK